MNGHHYCALLLLNANANVNQTTYEGYTALMFAGKRAFVSGSVTAEFFMLQFISACSRLMYYCFSPI